MASPIRKVFFIVVLAALAVAAVFFSTNTVRPDVNEIRIPAVMHDTSRN